MAGRRIENLQPFFSCNNLPTAAGCELQRKAKKGPAAVNRSHHHFPSKVRIRAACLSLVVILTH